MTIGVFKPFGITKKISNIMKTLKLYLVLVLSFICNSIFSQSVFYTGNNCGLEIDQYGYAYKNGKHYLVWSNGRYSSDNLYSDYDNYVKLSISTDGVNWTTNNIIPTSYGSYNHRIAIDNNNKIHIIYTDITEIGYYGSCNANVVYATDLTGAWEKQTVVNGSGGYVFYDSDLITLNQSGTVNVFYHPDCWWAWGSPLLVKKFNGSSWSDQIMVSNYGTHNQCDDRENIFKAYDIENKNLVLYVSSGFYYLTYHGNTAYTNKIFKIVENGDNYTLDQTFDDVRDVNVSNGNVLKTSADQKAIYLNDLLVYSNNDFIIDNLYINNDGTYISFMNSKDSYILKKTGSTFQLIDILYNKSCILINNLILTYSLMSENPKILWINSLDNNPIISHISPQLILSTASLFVGNILTITGKSFTPNSIAQLSFSSGSNVMVNTDIYGQFTYNYTIPNNINGLQSVRVTDNSTGQQTIPKSFTITAVTTTQVNLSISSPSNGQIYQATRFFNLSFEDQMLLKNGNTTYATVSGNPANRYYSYNVEYQIGSGGQWQLLKTVTGSALINSKISKTMSFAINIANSSCMVRVIDNYNNTIIVNSGVFSVAAYTSSIKVEMDWDKSFPKPNVSLQGIAADGTARVYLKVSKLNQTGSAIKSVAVNLQDGTSSRPSLLGKIQLCIDTIYSLEANNANSITATDNSADSKGEFWFWYVAPDDFSDSSTPFYSNVKERFVTAKIVATLTDGTTESQDLKITIVRPPLVMVHGLGSDSHTWDDFKYNDGTGGTEKFISSPLWLYKRAINLYDPQGLYRDNAIQLLNSNIKENSLQGNIEALHNMGYACNRVDYICHSMGGCVMRTAINDFSDKFYSKNSAANSIYKSYEKGFINKAITINTPHFGSPLADLIEEFSPELPKLSRLSLMFWNSLANRPLFLKFINPVDPNALLWTFEANPAVKNLQINSSNGGINFQETLVKNHLISSDIDFYSPESAEALANLDKYLEFIDEFIGVLQDYGSWEPTTQKFLDGLSKLNKAARIFTFIEWYSQQKGFPNFLGDSDAIVPLSSQLSGSSPNSNSVSVFTSPSLWQTKSYSHIGIIERSDVGDSIKLLLNSGINSSCFANSIGSTPTSPVYIRKISKVRSISNSENFDTTKVIIISPIRNMTYFADSTINIQYNLKDTANLINIKTIFQAQPYITDSRTLIQNYSVQISPDLLGNQLIYVIATYRINGITEKHIDTLSVNIQTTASLTGFKASPYVSSIRKNQLFYPSYLAIYSTFLANVPFNDTQLSVTIDNPLVVSYNSTGRYFEGVCDSTSSTFAVISYKGFKDTIYIEVQGSENVPSVVTEFVNDKIQAHENNFNFKLYPNPTSGQFIMEIENLSQVQGKISISNMLGQIVAEQKISEKSVTLDISNQSQGIYFVRYRDENGNEITKKIQKI